MSGAEPLPANSFFSAAVFRPPPGLCRLFFFWPPFWPNSSARPVRHDIWSHISLRPTIHYPLPTSSLTHSATHLAAQLVRLLPPFCAVLAQFGFRARAGRRHRVWVAPQTVHSHSHSNCKTSGPASRVLLHFASFPSVPPFLPSPRRLPVWASVRRCHPATVNSNSLSFHVHFTIDVLTVSVSNIIFQHTSSQQSFQFFSLDFGQRIESDSLRFASVSSISRPRQPAVLVTFLRA